jgi:hypothetical protein
MKPPIEHINVKVEELKQALDRESLKARSQSLRPSSPPL